MHAGMHRLEELAMHRYIFVGLLICSILLENYWSCVFSDSLDQLGKLLILRFLMLASISQSRCDTYANDLFLPFFLTCFVNVHLKH